MSTVEHFQQLMIRVSGFIDGRGLNASLQTELNLAFPIAGDWFQAVGDCCLQAIEDGWMCEREMGGIHFGRVLKPAEVTHGFSVDVVKMNSVKGPHHIHPNGEVDMIMPISKSALFDGEGKGWLVYEPGTAHFPTVTDGEAIVLYLLPHGKIEFTGRV